MKKPPVNVFVGSRCVGTIARSDLDADTFLFTYLNDTPAPAAVSLTMPPRADQYDSMAGLLPIFEMNLPEGGLRERLRLQFAKAVQEFDDLDLLAIVGSSQIGRLRFSIEDHVNEVVPEQDLAQLMAHHGTEPLFADLLDRFARYSGVSGVQPKVLMREMGRPAKMLSLGATHIVKSFNPAEYPELAANEYICTAGAAIAGLETARLTLSDDRSLLAVERFDRMPDGTYLGIEDFCVLTARRAHGRYDGSYEDIARRITDFVSPRHLAAAREQFALMVAYSCAIENGDAHLKNFAVLYRDAESPVTLAPAYDVVSTTPYSPRDTLALTLQGSKQFPSRATLVTFIRLVTGKTEKAANRVVQQVLAGAAHSRNMIERYATTAPAFAQALARSLDSGMARLAD